MSYLVLARKWRPQNFEQVVGQRPIVRTLQNAVDRNRVSHAMIFSGVRGVGKTTLARIMAKALNCQTGPTKIPCNTCESCLEITAGSSIDLHEIDGASNRGIQEIRELKENIRFFPTNSRFKIIIIDEVHMLTTEAFNALLKTIEEPPDHVYFIFATTELHKIPITILSRCQRYELSRVSSKDMTLFLEKIIEAEQVSVSDWAVAQIVLESEGSVRDALSLLDQVLSFTDTHNSTGKLEVTNEDVIEILGLVDRQVINSIARSLLSNDLSESITLLDEAYSYGIDLKRFTNELLLYFRSLIICKITNNPGKLLDFADHDLNAISELAKDYSAETLYNYFHLVLKGVEEMQYSKHPRLTLETTFMKVTQAGTVVPVSEMIEKLDLLLHDRSDSEEIISFKTDKPAKESAEPSENKTKKKQVISDPQPPVQDSAFAIKATKKNIRKDWDEFIEYVMDRKNWMAHVLRLSVQVREKDDDLILKYNEVSDCKMLQSSEHMKVLSEYAQDFFQKELKIKFKIIGNPIENSDSSSDDTPQEERRALAVDPLVKIATEIFDGQVSNIRTGPRFRQ